MAAHHGNLPVRTNTTSTGYDSDDERGDPSSTLGLLQERLQAWKHMTAYLEDYMHAVAKDQKQQAKDSEKILKTLSNPLKEGHHFDQSVGGVAGLFENLRANTQAIATSRAETEKNITGSVLPILERLHSEIKHKRKEIDKGAGKGTKALDEARNSSQAAIESLGQYTATFDSTGGRVTAKDDPYVLQRMAIHRLNRQIVEENNNRSDLMAVQNNFQQFEAHVVASVQQALTTFNQLMGGQCDREKTIYGDMASTAGHIRPDFEWNGFLQRHGHILISPNAPPRTADTISFPNMNHRATKPLIEGTLEHKSGKLGGLGGHKTAYFAVTPAGYMHEYKDNDSLRNDPSPEHSLYLPDCQIGAVDGTKFTVKGKDASGNKLAQKLAMSTEYSFKAHTPQDAIQWHQIIAAVCNGQTASLQSSPVGVTGAAAAAATPGTLNTQISPQQQQQTGVISPTQPTQGGVPLSAGTPTTPQQAQATYHGGPAVTELEPRKY